MNKKTVLDYVMNGGIEGNYFVGNKILANQPEGTYLPVVYKIIGRNGIDKTIPANPLIKICYLNNTHGSSEIERTREEWLGSILPNEKASSDEISAAKEGRNLQLIIEN